MNDSPNRSLLYRLRVQMPRQIWNLRKILKLSPAKGDVYYGDAAALYDAERETTRRWHNEQVAVEGFLDRLPRELSVLDVPLGTGRFVEFYRARGYAITGLDASDEMMAVARQKGGEYPVETVVGDAAALPWPDDSFDLVVSTRFLRHVLPYELARTALSEMARVSRGHAIIELGCRDGASRRVSPGKPMRDKLSRQDLGALLAEAGFEIVDEVITMRRIPRKYRIVFLLRRTGSA